MKSLKKAAFISVLVLIGLLDVLIYWNHHLYYRAGKSDNSEKKIALLEKIELDLSFE